MDPQQFISANISAGTIAVVKQNDSTLTDSVYKSMISGEIGPGEAQKAISRLAGRPDGISGGAALQAASHIKTYANLSKQGAEIGKQEAWAANFAAVYMNREALRATTPDQLISLQSQVGPAHMIQLMQFREHLLTQPEADVKDDQKVFQEAAFASSTETERPQRGSSAPIPWVMLWWPKQVQASWRKASEWPQSAWSHQSL